MFSNLIVKRINVLQDSYMGLIQAKFTSGEGDSNP